MRAPSRKTLLLLAGGALAVTLAGCGGRYYARGGAPVPSMASVAPGVWVVEDYPAGAVFYSDGSYWMWSDGTWYRSPYLDGSWARTYVNVVPYGIRRMRPSRYVRYQAPRRARVRPVPRYRPHPYRRGRVRVRSPHTSRRYVPGPSRRGQVRGRAQPGRRVAPAPSRRGAVRGRVQPSRRAAPAPSRRGRVRARSPNDGRGRVQGARRGRSGAPTPQARGRVRVRSPRDRR